MKIQQTLQKQIGIYMFPAISEDLNVKNILEEHVYKLIIERGKGYAISRSQNNSF